MNLSDYLFETGALKVSQYNKPFFYTTGKLGPIYINTHYLYGSGDDANKLLRMIDEQLLHNKNDMPSLLFNEILKQYENNIIFKTTADSIVKKISATSDTERFSYISGGERRDWFFSVISAHLLNKKHITIFKDGSVIISLNGKRFEDIVFLKDEDIIHICDLVTEASSFKNYWVPIIKNTGNRISSVYSVVDRKQGGNEYFRSENIVFNALVGIDQQFFDEAENKKYIDHRQNNLINSYFKDPDASMRDFLISNPDFINQVFEYDNKSLSKVKIMTEKNIYDLPEGYLKKIKAVLETIK